MATGQTLSRTIMTSTCTTVVVIMLLFFGGESLRPFSLTMLFGMFFGTYSTIYIAGPVLLLFREKVERALVAEAEADAATMAEPEARSPQD
jgi:SecD/SecF fusion protein